MANCRKCGKEIRFIKTLRGRWMPIDADPTDEQKRKTTSIVIEGGNIIEAVPHWATCPDADSFR